MKNLLKILIPAVLLFAIPFRDYAQAPPHPNGDNNPETSGGTTVNGGSAGAPVGNGTYILFMLAAMYAGRKAYQLNISTEEPV